MKNAIRSFALIIILILGVSFVSAQSANPVRLGFRGGLNLADNTFDVSPISKSARTAFAGGGYFEIGLSGDVYFTAELNYLMGGTSLNYQGSSATWKIDEIGIPVSLKYKANIEGSTVKPYFFAGGGPGFVMTSEISGSGGSSDLKNSTESTDWSFHAGGGIEITASEQVAVLFDVRYLVGLSNLDKGGSDSKSRNLGIIAGVSFALN